MSAIPGNRTLLKCLLLATFFGSGISYAETVTAISLELENAGRTGGYAEIGFPAFVNLTRVGDTWYPVGGRTLENKRILWGHVESSSISESEVSLKISYFMPTDKFTNGGRATFNISCTRNEDGTLSGTYEGIYYGETYTFWWMPKKTEAHLCSLSVCGKNAPSPPTGTAVGTINVRSTPESDFSPPGRNEHPRILFRKSDLPLLKAKSETPFGQKCLEYMPGWGPVGHGMLYQLAKYDGDEAKAAEYAESASKLVKFHMKDFSNGEDEHGQVAWTRRLEQVATTYDVCYDGWSPEFRHRVAWYLVNTAKTILNFHSDWIGTNFTWDIDGYAVGWYSGIGFAGMALYGSDSPDVPLFPWYGDGLRAPTIQPNPDLTVPEGMEKTVLSFRDADPINMAKEPGLEGMIPLPEYICATGLTVEKDRTLEPFGGDPLYRPAPGETVQHGDTQTTWRVLPDEPVSIVTTYGHAFESIDLAKLTNRGSYTTVYLYAVVENPEPRWVEFQDNLYLVKNSSRLESKMYINGVLRRPGDFMYLEQGMYSVLLAVPNFHFQPWGEQQYAPRLVEPGYAGYGRREVNLDYLDYEKLRREEYAASVEPMTGGNPFFASLLFRGVGSLSEYFAILQDKGVSFPRGLDGTTIPRNESDNPAAKFGTAVQNMFNIPANPHGDVVQNIVAMFESGNVPMVSVSYNDKPNPAMLAHAFGLAPDSLRVILKPKWMEMTGVTDENSAEELIKHDPVYALINFPLDVDVSVRNETQHSAGSARPKLTVVSGGSTPGAAFSVRKAGRVSVRMYDVTGRLLTTLFSGHAEAGTHTVQLNPERVGSRACVLELRTSSGETVRENLMVLK